MSVHIADLLGVQIDLITRGVPLPITAERRLFADALEDFDTLDDDEDDDFELRRPEDNDLDLVELFGRDDR
ncbi:MAG: hypothetical protein SFX73_12560 [Kofleriaceae bacterium]|nr:hypothetical protein [Kofleriaceae bacterium]